MASTHKSLRSSTASKRPTTSIADGQIALNTNAASPGLFFKDSTGADIIKVGPVHVGTTAPNATPASGGSTGNSTGEVWLDTSLTPVGVKIWDGSAWQNATPAGSTTVQGLLELATNTETQTGTATALAVTPAGLQSKMSDSVATTSSTTIASSTAVKSAYDVAAAALPATGGTMSGELLINSTGSLVFEGATENEFETTLAVADPTADRTATIPDQSGNFLISGNASIVNADVNASAAIAGTKISPNFGSQNVQTTGVISHGLGTAGAPTITFTGDTNTGVYSPGADQVAISTGGSGRLFVDASGNVGVGQAPSGDQEVSIRNSGFTALLVGSTNASGAMLVLDGDSNGDGAGGDYSYIYHNSSGALEIQQDSPSGTNEIQFKTGGDNLRATLNATGLGLGTSSPTEILHAVGNIKLEVAAANNATRSITARSDFGSGTFFDNAGVLLVQDTAGSSGGHIELQTMPSGGSSMVTALTIDDGQRVGIGTTSPGAVLDVFTGTNRYVRFSTDGDASLIRTTESGGANRGFSVAGEYIKFETGTNNGSTITERARIDSSGRVGIGTTSPGCILDVQESLSGAFSFGRFFNTNTTANSSTGISFATSSDGTGRERARLVVSDDGSDNGYLALSTRGGGTLSERARIDSSGRLLVGTASARTNFYNSSGPSAGLQVEGNNNNVAAISIVANTSGNANSPQLIFGKSAGTAVGSNTAVGTNINIGRITFQGNDGSQFVPGAEIRADTDATPGANDMPGRLVFSTTADGASAPTERMRLDNRGQLSLQSTTSTFDVATTASAGTAISTIFARHSATSGSPGTGTVSFRVYSNGNVQNTNNSYGALSDIKLKENIVDASSQWDDLKALQVRNYNLKEGQTHTQIGLIAQEAELISPGLVSESPDRDEEGNDLGTVTKSVNYSVLYMKAVKALQEAMERIEVLEAKVTALEGN